MNAAAKATRLSGNSLESLLSTIASHTDRFRRAPRSSEMLEMRAAEPVRGPGESDPALQARQAGADPPTSRLQAAAPTALRLRWVTVHSVPSGKARSRPGPRPPRPPPGGSRFWSLRASHRHQDMRLLTCRAPHGWAITGQRCNVRPNFPEAAQQIGDDEAACRRSALRPVRLKRLCNRERSC